MKGGAPCFLRESFLSRSSESNECGGTAPAKTRESARGSGAYFCGDARQSKAFARPQCVVATPHGLVLVLTSHEAVCACVPAAGRAGERGAEIRRQNASHRASIARHHRAATPTAAAAAATALRGPEMARRIAPFPPWKKSLRRLLQMAPRNLRTSEPLTEPPSRPRTVRTERR